MLVKAEGYESRYHHNDDVEIQIKSKTEAKLLCLLSEWGVLGIWGWDIEDAHGYSETEDMSKEDAENFVNKKYQNHLVGVYKTDVNECIIEVSEEEYQLLKELARETEAFYVSPYHFEVASIKDVSEDEVNTEFCCKLDDLP